MSAQSQAYVDPRKIVAAGALFTDATGDILLVNPTYKPQWEIPGGVVEAFETPLAGCVREVHEEIGLTIAPTRLLGIDHSITRAQGKEVLRFIFWGGILTPPTIAAIRLPTDNELSEFGFFSLATAQTLLSPSLGAQIARILAILDGSATAYGEHAYQ